MNYILLNVLSAVFTAFIIPVITMLGTKVISWMNSKIKNEEMAGLLTQVIEAVINAVRSVFQTHVEQFFKG